jgi:hypothetical protein
MPCRTRAAILALAALLLTGGCGDDGPRILITVDRNARDEIVFHWSAGPVHRLTVVATETLAECDDDRGFARTGSQTTTVVWELAAPGTSSEEEEAQLEPRIPGSVAYGLLSDELEPLATGPHGQPTPLVSGSPYYVTVALYELDGDDVTTRRGCAVFTGP